MLPLDTQDAAGILTSNKLETGPSNWQLFDALRHEVKVLVSACAEGKTEIIDGSCEELRMLVMKKR